MRAVLAAAFELAEQLDLVELVVAVRCRCTRYRPLVVLLAAVDDDVEAVERPEQPLGLADVDVDRLDLRRRRVAAERRRRDAVELAVLVGDDEPALRVDAHVDPRALRRPSARSRAARP